MSPWLRVALAISIALSAAPAGADPPDGAEQEFLWQVNFARSAPGDWAHEHGLGTTLDAFAPAPPLAWNATLVDAAQAKAQEFVDLGYFGHDSPVTGSPNNLIVNVFHYPLAGGPPGFYFGPGCDFGCAYPGFGNTAVESLAGGGSPLDAPENPVRALLGEICIGDTIGSCGTTLHRMHLLGASTTAAPMIESGAGHAIRITQEIGGPFETHFWVFHSGFPANAPASMPQILTGVAFADADLDGRYDAGEGIAGVTVQANALAAVTNDAGGWSLSVPNGSYDLSCAGAAFAGTASANDVAVTDANRQVDCISGEPHAIVDFAPEPGALGASVAVLALAAVTMRRCPTSRSRSRGRT